MSVLLFRFGRRRIESKEQGTLQALESIKRRKNMLPSIKASDAVTNALHHVKEFMTDSQKAHTMLKEGKILMEQGNLQGAIGTLSGEVSYSLMTIFQTASMKV